MDLQYSKDREKYAGPGLKTFTALVAVMMACVIVFVILFITCLVVMATSPAYRLSSGQPGRFAVISGIDGIRAAIAPERIGVDPGKRAKACILILTRNEELRPLIRTLREFDDRFNKRYNYPLVFLNDKPFSPEFEYSIRQILPGSSLTFARISAEDWTMPEDIDKERARKSLRTLKHVIHGSSQSYRKMCRWYSGRFMDHPAVSEYEWFWRIEPGVSFPCDIPYDPFVKMEKQGKVIGFSILMGEIPETITTLFQTVQEYIRRAGIRPDKKLFSYFTYTSNNATMYNGCHIWNNFEIARFDFFRSRQYKRYFEYLDKAGGFFYERWGDAPVISLAAALFLRSDQLHQFEDIGYRHDPGAFCPNDPQLRRKLLCACDPYDYGDTTMAKCMALWRRMDNVDFYEEQ